MPRLLIVVLVGALAVHVYRTQIAPPPAQPADAGGMEIAAVRHEKSLPDAEFRCDGREHCSQMSSCAEAEFFLSNCPHVKMDGDGDGRPCERGPC